MSSETTGHTPGADFAETHWTRVLRAQGESPEARAALADLAAAYWPPVYRFIRREGRDDDFGETPGAQLHFRTQRGHLSRVCHGDGVVHGYPIRPRSRPGPRPS